MYQFHLRQLYSATITPTLYRKTESGKTFRAIALRNYPLGHFTREVDAGTLETRYFADE